MKESSLREAQILMTTILKDIDKICKENNIKYWIESGTLLGAVRHKGFIPWDDDIDIGMLRKDYNKFLEISEKYLNEDLILTNFRNEENIGYQWSKVRHKYSEIVEDGDLSYNKGLFVDIFPYDFYEKDQSDIFSKYKKNYKRKFAVLYFSNLELSNITNKKDKLKSLLCKIYRKIILRKSFNDICNELGKIVKNETVSKKEYLNYGIEVSAYENKIKYTDVFPLKEIKFEDIVVSCPNNSHNCLVAMFGEKYMEMPKENNRICHNKGICIWKSRVNKKL